MPASFPSAAKTFTSRAAGQVIASAHLNDLQDEVNAVETDLVAGKVGGVAAARLTAQTFTGIQQVPGGAVAAVGLGVGAANVGLYASSTSTLEVAAAGVKAIGITATAISSPVQPRCSVFHSVAQTVQTSSATALTFDSETFDIGGLHSTSVSPTKVIIPAGGDGHYLVVGDVYFIGSAAGTRRDVYIYVNGVAQVDIILVPNANAQRPQATWLGPLVATDFVELFVNHDVGAPLSVGNNSPGQFNRLSVTKLW
jgi:hypothetical protein